MAKRLLKKVAYQSRSPEQRVTLTGKEITCSNTFPYNPESKTADKTALDWAKRYQAYKKLLTPTATITDNKPFQIKIVNLESRGEGGRAYKVIDDQNHLFDLREDQVVEIISRCGIKKGGVIPGKFQWGVVGSQMKLALVGGKLHKEMKSGSDARLTADKAKLNGTTITPSNCVAGGVYVRGGTYFLYVGRCSYSSVSWDTRNTVETTKGEHALIELWRVSDNEPFWFSRYKTDNKNVPAWDTLSFEDKIDHVLKCNKERPLSADYQKEFKAFDEVVASISKQDLDLVRKTIDCSGAWHLFYETIERKPSYDVLGLNHQGWATRGQAAWRNTIVWKT